MFGITRELDIHSLPYFFVVQVFFFSNSAVNRLFIIFTTFDLDDSWFRPIDWVAWSSDGRWQLVWQRQKRYIKFKKSLID